MKIGLDFDNTIVSYDALFHMVAREQNHIPATVAVNKNAVRDYLREAGREDVWTEMQGYVYGARMQEAAAYAGAVDVLRDLADAGHELFVISHKTRVPYMGPAYDLHEAARQWIKTHLTTVDGTPLIPAEQIYFHEKKEEKIARIGELKCDVFLDDLPEILNHPSFPAGVKKYLFATEPSPDFTTIAHWDDFAKVFTHG